MTEGLPIGLVRHALKCTTGPVLDPFLGAGTVLTEAMLTGKSAAGVDINPFMCFVSRVKTRSYLASEVTRNLKHLFHDANSWKTIDLQTERLTRLRRYYTPQTIKKLESLRLRIVSISDKKVRNLFLLCFVNVALKTSRMRKTPALRFRTTTYNHLGVSREFQKKISEIVVDLNQPRARAHPRRLPIVFRNDSRFLDFLDEDYDLLITSPPYCNNVDFVRHSQLELMWLGYASTGKDLGRIRHDAITSCEAMAHASKDDGILPNRVNQLVEEVRERSERRYYKVIQQYFCGMASHLDAAFSVLSKRGKAVYVIGDSWFQDVHVPTHEILRILAGNSGFRKVRVRWLRRRFTGRPHDHNLSEYIIELEK